MEHKRFIANGFPRGARITFNTFQLDLLKTLRSHEKVVKAYAHHRESNAHQTEALNKLASPEGLPFKHVVVHSDWKELETLPIVRKATGEMFYATARKQISVFGSCVIEHSPASTRHAPVIK